MRDGDNRLNQKIANCVSDFTKSVLKLALPAMCLLIWNAVVSTHDDVTRLIVITQGQDKRIENLESWRNNMEAFAEGISGEKK